LEQTSKIVEMESLLKKSGYRDPRLQNAQTLSGVFTETR
jgi:hypothetical protein